MVGKHGNRAATSSSGSADVLTHASQPSPAILAVTPATLSAMYERSNYAFLYAPVFHHGMRFVAPIRRALGWRTIFNLLGPLTNPVEASSSAQSERGPHAPQRPSLLEARVVGIARRDLGPVFAEALQMAGARKALVVCGDEDLDEISCAGITHCWLVQASGIANFTLHPADFGLPTHSLSTVSPAPDPDAPGAATNAAILRRLLHDELEMDDPIACFVLLNAAALFVVSGICEADSSAMGAGDDAVVLTERGPGGQRWKEGVRRARWAIRSGRALDMWRRYVDCSLELAKLLPTE